LSSTRAIEFRPFGTSKGVAGAAEYLLSRRDTDNRPAMPSPAFWGKVMTSLRD
jgi:hypothetical protein